MEMTEEEKYLMFELKDELYGIPILKVNEIIGLMEIIHVPRTPNFMKGVINLRGKIIPVMDLRIKFEMSEKEYDEQTCIIIVEIPVKKKMNFVGVIVDKVAEVVNIYQKDIEAPPEYGQEDENEFLTGIGKVKGKVVMLLDIEKTVKSQEVISMLSADISKDSQEKIGV